MDKDIADQKDMAIDKIDQLHELLFETVKNYAIGNFNEINDGGIKASICINALVILAVDFQNKFGLPKDTIFKLLLLRESLNQNTEKLAS